MKPVHVKWDHISFSHQFFSVLSIHIRPASTEQQTGLILFLLPWTCACFVVVVFCAKSYTHPLTSTTTNIDQVGEKHTEGWSKQIIIFLKMQLSACNYNIFFFFFFFFFFVFKLCFVKYITVPMRKLSLGKSSSVSRGNPAAKMAPRCPTKSVLTSAKFLRYSLVGRTRRVFVHQKAHTRPPCFASSERFKRNPQLFSVSLVFTHYLRERCIMAE